MWVGQGNSWWSFLAPRDISDWWKPLLRKDKILNILNISFMIKERLKILRCSLVVEEML